MSKFMSLLKFRESVSPIKYTPHEGVEEARNAYVNAMELPIDAVPRIEAAKKYYAFCPLCGDESNYQALKDRKSRDEFVISGMCQPCQDAFFSDPS